MEEKVIIGTIINTHGIKGELKINASTDFPDERFKPGQEIWIGDQSYTIETHRVHKGYDLVSLKDYQNINLVEHLKRMKVYAYKDENLLDENEYYISDWQGCEVYNEGVYLGKVVDVYENTYQDILHVDYRGKKLLIPCVEAFIKNKDIEHKRIDVSLIKGFIDDEN